MNVPETKASDPSETRPGLNHIVVKTVQFGLHPMIMEKDVAVRVRDGHALYANVFRPEAQGRYPVVISADIYGKDSIHLVYAGRNPALAITLGQYDASRFCAWESPDPGFWVPNGYAVVKLGLRGTSGSMAPVEVMSRKEAQDYYDAIEWAGVQLWSDGKVGMNGVSYLAMAQWGVAQLNPPHLKAMIPWEGVSDMYREWSFHGGIPETAFTRQWIKGVAARSTQGAPIEDLTRMEREHPLWDEYWEDKHGNLADIRVPLCVGASWSTQGLHNRGTIEGFRQASSQYKWIEIHGRKEWETYYSREALERQLAFFDFFLKGVENDWLDTPRVRIEVRDRFYQGAVRYESEWPIARTHYVPLYLDASSAALSRAPLTAESMLSYDSTAPLTAESGNGRALFAIRFDEDTELTGYMKLRLWVSTDAGDDMDLFVAVHKLDRRGKQVHFPDSSHSENGRVASGWLRASHCELDEKRSTPYQPWLRHRKLLKLKPGEAVPVDIEIWPSSTRFRGGESLLLSVQGSEAPLPRLSTLPPEHGYRFRHDETVNRGRHVIYTGGRYDSHLLVPVIPKRD